MSTIIERTSGLVIGTVESVAPNEIRVILSHEAPQSTALNTGVPTSFPKLNGYVLIPNEGGSVIGIVAWLGVQRSTLPKKGSTDPALVDLPFPVRLMILTPVGTLVVERNEPGAYEFCLKRGVSVFPSVGDQVLLPTLDQLRSIIESQGADRRVTIGTSPLAGGAAVSIDPDKLFGRHVAVLGNTGSGKSCSVAGLIRWSLESAAEARIRSKTAGAPNARFIVLDPNGEYLNAFSDMEGASRVFRVPGTLTRATPSSASLLGCGTATNGVHSPAPHHKPNVHCCSKRLGISGLASPLLNQQPSKRVDFSVHTK